MDFCVNLTAFGKIDEAMTRSDRRSVRKNCFFVWKMYCGDRIQDAQAVGHIYESLVRNIRY